MVCIRRIGVVLHSPLYGYEDLFAETWAVPSRGYSFLRCHRLLRGEDVVCEATSVWALLELDTHKPLRVSEHNPNFDTVDTPDLAMPERIRISHEDVSLLGKYTVRYADTDQNAHMNNTAYADMLCGFLDLHGKYVDRFSINYYQEAPLAPSWISTALPERVASISSVLCARMGKPTWRQCLRQNPFNNKARAIGMCLFCW